MTEETQPEDKEIFKKDSPGLSKWIVVVGLVIGGLLALAFFFPSSGPKKAIAHADPEMSRVFPDEIQPDVLRALVQTEKRKMKKMESAEGEAKAMETAFIAPTGSMAIFISDAAAGGKGPLGIPMGTKIEAIIEQTVSAGGNGLPIIAMVTSDFAREDQILIPRGSRLFGQTQGNSANQLSIRFSRVVFPGGEDHSFSGVSIVEGQLDRKGGSRALAILAGAALTSTGVFAPSGTGYQDTFLRNSQMGGMNEASRDLNYFHQTDGSPMVKIKANKRISILVDKPI